MILSGPRVILLNIVVAFMKVIKLGAKVSKLSIDFFIFQSYNVGRKTKSCKTDLL